MKTIITSEEVDFADAISDLETINPELYAMLTRASTPDVTKLKDQVSGLEFSVFKCVEGEE